MIAELRTDVLLLVLLEFSIIRLFRPYYGHETGPVA